MFQKCAGSVVSVPKLIFRMDRTQKYMALKEKETTFRSAIVRAVAVLDRAPGSRRSLSKARAEARKILSEVYGRHFEDDLKDYLETDPCENCGERYCYCVEFAA